MAYLNIAHILRLFCISINYKSIGIRHEGGGAWQKEQSILLNLNYDEQALCAISSSVAAKQHELPQIFWGKSLNQAAKLWPRLWLLLWLLLLLLCHATRHADCLHNLSCAKHLAIALYLRYIYCSTHMHKYSRYSVTTRDTRTRTMATDSMMRRLPPPAVLATPRWRHYNPHSWPRSSIEYCTQICAYIVLDISMISLLHISSISRRDPGLSFSYVCAYIRSERL